MGEGGVGRRRGRGRGRESPRDGERKGRRRTGRRREGRKRGEWRNGEGRELHGMEGMERKVEKKGRGGYGKVIGGEGKEGDRKGDGKGSTI